MAQRHLLHRATVGPALSCGLSRTVVTLTSAMAVNYPVVNAMPRSQGARSCVNLSTGRGAALNSDGAPATAGKPSTVFLLIEEVPLSGAEAGSRSAG